MMAYMVECTDRFELENTEPETIDDDDDTWGEVEDYKTSQPSQKRKRPDRQYPCTECEWEGATSDGLKKHTESKHEGIVYPCDECSFSSIRAFHLKHHKEAKHDGIRYPCDQCNASFVERNSLELHVESKHEGIKYLCDQCEYKGSKNALWKHKKFKHSGIIYQCEECEYDTTNKAALKRHFASKHEKLKYSCAHCEYIANRSDHLNEHMKRKHSEVYAYMKALKGFRHKAAVYIIIFIILIFSQKKGVKGKKNYYLNVLGDWQDIYFIEKKGEILIVLCGIEIIIFKEKEITYP